MEIACLDLEGVLIPEVWVEFAAHTGIDALRLTTRDQPDYDILMKHRLRVLAEHKMGMQEIQEVVAMIKPLPGAPEFMTWLHSNFQVVILSDTYYEFVLPLMPQIGNPTLFCHHLEVAADGRIVDYVLRQKDPKREAVKAFQGLNFRVIAAGDSYNDINMLGQAEAGFLFHAPDSISAEFPQFPSVQTYDDLKEHFIRASTRKLA